MKGSGRFEMDCDSLREDMLEVLYGEADAQTQQRVARHHRDCASCREELEGLRGVREALGGWKLPEAKPRPWARYRPPSWLVAAAILLLVLGGAFGLSGSELSLDGGRLAFRLGRSGVAEALAEQELRHQAEIRALQERLDTLGPGGGDAWLAEVDRRIRASEARQAVLFSAGLAELGERTEAQRQYDLARVSASLSYLDGRTGQQLARQSQLMDHLVQASSPMQER